jgi:hypothetical protein
MPTTMSRKPHLTVNYTNSGQAKQNIATMYTVQGLSWRVNYTLEVNKNNTMGKLTGFATVMNQSGSHFERAALKLIAGNVHTLTSQPRGLKTSAMLSRAEMSDAVTEESAYEYHVYRLEDTFNLSDQQTLKVNLVKPIHLDIIKKLEGKASAVPASRDAYPMNEPVEAILSFRNIASQSLGGPLPQGIMRVYSAGQDSTPLPIGETNISSTPKNAWVDLRLGQAADITIERNATQFEKLGSKSSLCTWEIAIRNSKPTSQVITLLEILPGKWTIKDSSHAYETPTRNIAKFSVTVPPSTDGVPTMLKYSYESIQ